MNNIGRELKMYRERSGLSQGEAELTLELSTGSLSRFENNKVNPSKETLLKLVDLYDLNALETAELFGIDIVESYSNIINYTKELVESNEIDKKIQLLVDSFTKDLNLLNITVCLFGEDDLGKYIYPVTYTQTWFARLVDKILGKPVVEFKYYIGATVIPYIAKSAVEGGIYKGTKLSKFISPPASLRISNLIEKVTRAKSIICYPIIDNNNNKLGAVQFVSANETNWDKLDPALNSIADLVASVVVNNKSE